MISLLERIKTPRLSELGAVVGLTSEKHKKSLSDHQKRYIAYKILNQIISIVLYLVIGIVGFAIVGLSILMTGILLSVNSSLVSGAIAILYILSILLSLQISIRITSTVLDRYYADTLSFVTALYLLLEIHQEDALLLPTQRGIVLKRIRALKRIITLLSYQYTSGSSTSTGLAQDIFRKMEFFVSEKEDQVLAPSTRTRSTLEKELMSLVEILLTSQYGEFKYGKKIPEKNEIQTTRSIRIVRGTIRIVGFVIPLFILIGLMAYPDQLSFIEPYNNIVALVCFFWLLLGIDANLNLGVVDRITGLAKTMKDLR